MKRFLVVFVAVILIVTFMVCSVSAEVLPDRFIDSVRDTDFVDTSVNCNLDASNSFVWTSAFYRNGSTGEERFLVDGFTQRFTDSVTATAAAELSWAVSLFYSNFKTTSGDVIIDNPVRFPALGLVNGNTLSVSLRVGTQCPTNATYTKFRVLLYDIDGSYTVKQGTYSRYQDSSGYWHYVGTFEFSGITQDTVSYVPEFYYSRTGTGIQEDFDIDISYNYFYVNMPSSQYNSLSDAGVEDQLDDMINRPVVPEPPAGSGTVDDYHDIESGLLDDTEAGRNEALSALGSIGVIYGFMTSFTYLVGICELFFGLPLITELLTVSLALSVFILLFNLFTDIDRRVRSGKKESAKGKYAKKAHKGGHK